MSSVSVNQGNVCAGSYCAVEPIVGERREGDLLLEVRQEAALNPRERDCQVDAEQYIQAAKNAREIFEKTFWARKGIVARVCLKVASAVSKSASIHSYNTFVDTLAAKTAEKYKANFKGLVERYIAEKDAFKKDFLEKVICVAKEAIASRKVNEGFFYEVKRGEKTVCYLIGTHHKANEHMIRDSRIDKIINSSCELITEIGFSRFVRGSSWLGDHCSWNKMRFFMDGRLMSLANEKAMRTPGLEALFDGYKALFMGYFNAGKKLELLTIGQEKITWMKDHASFAQEELLEAWQNGDKKETKRLIDLILFPSLKKSVFSKRNKKWLEGENGLIQKVKTSEEPICIAVGAGHLFFKDGIIAAFKKEGLTISRIHSEAAAV